MLLFKLHQVEILTKNGVFDLNGYFVRFLTFKIHNIKEIINEIIDVIMKTNYIILIKNKKIF